MLVSGDEQIVGYTDACAADERLTSLCDTVIIGERVKGDGEIDISLKKDATAIFSTEELYRKSNIKGGLGCYALKKDKKEIEILLD